MAKKRKPLGYYRGKSGLLNAQKETIEKAKELGKTPHRTDLSEGIRSTIYKGGWQEFEVSSWQEFIESCGLEPYRKKRGNKKKGYYKGQDGLQKAKEVTLNFFKDNGKSPTVDDLPHIYSGITNHLWTDIRTWKEFILFCGLVPVYGAKTLDDFPELVRELHPTKTALLIPK